LGPKDEAEALEVMVQGVEDMLDVFGDLYLNKYLVYSVLERVVIALVPDVMEIVV